jgi:putative transcriptional regulator
MAKKVRKSNLFTELATGLSEAISIARNEADSKAFRAHVPEKVDVRALRKGMKMTQEEFAAAFGFSAARVKDWEQERSSPDGAVRAYLKVIERKPEEVLAALKAA